MDDNTREEKQDKDTGEINKICQCGCGRTFTNRRKWHLHNRNLKLREKRQACVISAATKALKKVQEDELSCGVCTYGFDKKGAFGTETGSRLRERHRKGNDYPFEGCPIPWNPSRSPVSELFLHCIFLCVYGYVGKVPVLID